MEKWPLGVFASLDAGRGVRLEVAHELGVPTIQLHTPHNSTRTKHHTENFLERLEELDIHISVVFGGFDGESYADIPTVVRTVGLVPPATRAARLKRCARFPTSPGCCASAPSAYTWASCRTTPPILSMPTCWR